MSSEELKPCPCGAACNTEEGPYPINHARDLWRLDCVEPDCGWSIVAGSSEEALKDWNRRAPNALEAENARLLAANLDCVAHFEQMRAQLAAMQGGMGEALETYAATYSEHWKPGMPILEPISDAVLADESATGANSDD